MTTLTPLHSTTSRAPDPDAPPDTYRQAVAASIQDLASGLRPRDPAMSGVSTGRLVVEGVVENLRIYRLYREEKEREARERSWRREVRDGGEKRCRDVRRQGRESDDRGKAHKRGEGEEERKGHGHGHGHGHEERRHRRSHRSTDGEREHRRRRRHLAGRVSSDETQETQREPEGRPTPADDPATPEGRDPMSAAPAVAKALLGPDGTPFGSLPTKGEGVGLISHAKNMYRHFKAEQDAGHRNKGLVEKHFDALLQKKRGVKGVAKGGEEALLVVEESEERSRGDGHQRRRCRAKSRNGESRAIKRDLPIFVPVNGKPSAEQRKSHAPSQSSKSVRQAIPSTVKLSPELQQSYRGGPVSRRSPASALKSKASKAGRNGSEFMEPSPERVHSPAPPPSARSQSTPSLSDRSGTCVQGLYAQTTGGSRAASRAPTIRVQSPMPPKQTLSVQSPAVSVMDIAPAVGPAALPTPLQAPLPSPPPSNHVAGPQADSDRDAFLTSIQIGVKLKKVLHENEKDTHATRTDEARIQNPRVGTPSYQITPHSQEVEALEHAQAVEERERTQEEERGARSTTLLTAPQPKTKRPSNFAGELAGKLGQMSLNEKASGGTEAGAAEPDGIRPRASNGSWRTVFNENEEEERLPNRQFRDELVDRLSRPPTAALHPRKETPAPDVFVSLSANIAQPGWQSAPGWNFSNVPVDGNDGSSEKR